MKTYVHDATHVIDWNVIQVEPEGYFQVETYCFVDKRECFLQNHIIRQVMVQWNHLSPYEATWELEIHMREAYPNLFQEDSDDT